MFRSVLWICAVLCLSLGTLRPADAATFNSVGQLRPAAPGLMSRAGRSLQARPATRANCKCAR